jgi:hypothetical protein
MNSESKLNENAKAKPSQPTVDDVKRRVEEHRRRHKGHKGYIGPEYDEVKWNMVCERGRQMQIFWLSHGTIFEVECMAHLHGMDTSEFVEKAIYYYIHKEHGTKPLEKEPIDKIGTGKS